MARYSIQSRHWIFVKSYGFLCFARNTDKNVGKNISKNLNSQKRLDHAKKSATDALKTASKRTIQETAGGTGDLIGNEIAAKITRVSKSSPKNSSEANEEKILRERYISLFV